MHSIIKYLHRLGWEIHVVTEIDSDYAYDKDPVLKSVNIYPNGQKKGSINNAKSEQSRQAPKSILKSFLFRDNRLIRFARTNIKSLQYLLKFRIWSFKAYKISCRVIKKENINYVLVSVPRLDTLHTGYKIKKKIKKVNLICEYRDTISENLVLKNYYNSFTFNLIGSLEKKAIKSVDKFIFLTSKIKEIYSKWYKFNDSIKNGIVITNGYDAEEYEQIKQEPKVVDKKGLIINHIGSLYDGRNPIPFLEAVSELALEDKESCEVNFIGEMSKFIKNEIQLFCEKNNLGNVNIMGSVGHTEALQFMVDADVNIIITHSKGSEYAIPGKVFEYIGAGRPILAITDDKLLKELILNEKLGWVCENKVIEIKNTINLVFDLWRNNELFGISASKSKFSRENMVKQMSGFLLS